MSVVLVTGAGRGIGADVARLAAERGWSVAINYAAKHETANALRDELLGTGADVIAIQADVADPDSVESMFDQVEEELGPVTGLVNNAGVGSGIGPIETLDIENTRRMLDVNVFGLLVCCRCAVKRMSTFHGGVGGSIVNISSAAARTGGPGTYVAYAAGKGAVDTLTIGLAKEQGAAGIRVNAVRPGVINTDMIAAGVEMNPDWLKGVTAATPLGRIGKVRDVSAAVVWLLSEEASFTSGAIIDVSGGRVTP